MYVNNKTNCARRAETAPEPASPVVSLSSTNRAPVLSAPLAASRKGLRGLSTSRHRTTPAAAFADCCAAASSAVRVASTLAASASRPTGRMPAAVAPTST